MTIQHLLKQSRSTARKSHNESGSRDRIGPRPLFPLWRSDQPLSVFDPLLDGPNIKSGAGESMRFKGGFECLAVTMLTIKRLDGFKPGNAPDMGCDRTAADFQKLRKRFLWRSVNGMACDAELPARILKLWATACNQSIELITLAASSQDLCKHDCGFNLQGSASRDKGLKFRDRCGSVAETVFNGRVEKTTRRMVWKQPKGIGNITPCHLEVA